jgi:hypothetical protein
MTKKIAVAVLHGIGEQKEDFAEIFSEELTKRFTQNIQSYLPEAKGDLIIQPIYWGSVFNEKENEMWNVLSSGARLDFARIRQFVIQFFGDAIAYQPSSHPNPNYLKVHEIFAEGLQKLSHKAGTDAPLYLIAHSLGSVISSNYIYDLQYIPHKINKEVQKHIQDTPLEKGETLAGFYSLGSPLALWNLRYADFDKPIIVPSPHLNDYAPRLKGGWVNMYDKDDVFGYPLKPLNSSYEKAITEELEINSGGILNSWTPLSHMYYFTTKDIINRIGDDLASAWKIINRFT